jgi:hypothetical protein
VTARASDWTEDHSRSAQSEGWGLFIVEDRLWLQRDDETRVFPDDEQALAFVREKARTGSPLHRLALELNQQPLSTAPATADKRRPRARAASGTP